MPGIELFVQEFFPSMAVFPDFTTVKYSEFGVNFLCGRTNSLTRARTKWLKQHCGTSVIKDIPIHRQELKSFILKLCVAYKEDKSWNQPHVPIPKLEVDHIVQLAFPRMPQIANQWSSQDLPQIKFEDDAVFMTKVEDLDQQLLVIPGPNGTASIKIEPPIASPLPTSPRGAAVKEAATALPSLPTLPRGAAAGESATALLSLPTSPRGAAAEESATALPPLPQDLEIPFSEVSAIIDASPKLRGLGKDLQDLQDFLELKSLGSHRYLYNPEGTLSNLLFVVIVVVVVDYYFQF